MEKEFTVKLKKLLVMTKFWLNVFLANQSVMGHEYICTIALIRCFFPHIVGS